MDYVAIIKRLRPDVTWTGDAVNGFSLDTIALTYNSSDPLPTELQCVAEWAIMLKEDKVVKCAIDLRSAMLSRAGNLSDPLAMGTLRSIKNCLQAQSDAAQTMDAHNGYLRINNVNYTMDGSTALQFTKDLEQWNIELSDFRNAREAELSGLTDAELDSYDFDTPNGYSWPAMPDPSTY
jgi:hypothetical protein